MFGGASVGGSAQAQTTFTPDILAGGMAVNRASQSSGNAPSLSWTPWVFLAFAFLYIVWAMIEQSQKVQDAVSPSNIAFNVRNLLVIGLTAILGIVLLKLAFTKLTAWGVPGAAVINQIVGAA